MGKYRLRMAGTFGESHKQTYPVIIFKWRMKTENVYAVAGPDGSNKKNLRRGFGPIMLNI
jgi:hypothetical protein